jgi:FkbM family methyltransferase
MMATLEEVLKAAKDRLAAGDANGAGNLYQQILDRVPNNSEALFGALQAAVASGDRARIVPARQRLAAALLSFARQQFNSAVTAIEQAEVAVKRALTLDPTLAEATTLAWKIDHLLGATPQYFSQFGQDTYFNEHLFKNMRGGVFVDVGAYDGISGSNTLFYEKFLGWTGLCIEPDPRQFAALAAIRSVPCVETCIADADGTAEFLAVREGLTMKGGLAAYYRPEDAKSLAESSKVERVAMPTRDLDGVLAEYGIDSIDYLSIDTEGSELVILKSVDLARFGVRALSVENNHNTTAIADYLASAGYRRLIRLGVDDLYAKT